MKYHRLHRPSFSVDRLPGWAKVALEGGELVMFEERDEASKVAAYLHDPNLGEIPVMWGDFLTLEAGALRVRPGDWVAIDKETILPPEYA